jgi:UDPglucose 6-dehydrogenase
MREAPSRVVIEALRERGAQVVGYDPVAMTEARHIYAGRRRRPSPASAMDAVQGADALVIMTEWKAFRSPDFDALEGALKPGDLRRAQPLRARGGALHGLEYHAIGRGAAPR